MAKLNARLAELQWWFHEHGGTSIYNEFKRFAKSATGAAIGAPGARTFGDLDLALVADVASAPIPPGANRAGQQVIPGQDGYPIGSPAGVEPPPTLEQT